MKLYFSKGACSLGVRITIHEMGLNAEFESVDLKTKKTETGADFLKINPKGAVPALMTDEKAILTENAVIHQYLADMNDAEQLLPPLKNFERYKVLEWLSYIGSDVHKSYGPFFNPQIPEDLKQNLFMPMLIKKLTFIDDYLKDKEFLMGKFSLADAYLFVMLFWAKKFNIGLDKLPNLTRYFNSLKNRPSVKKSLTEEGLEV